MKKLLSTSVAAATLAASISAPAFAEGELSASVGYLSDYYFRGAHLGESGAYGGLEYGVDGFFVGVWAVDDGGANVDFDAEETSTGNDGLEVDYYLGYGAGDDNFAWYVGYTTYEYTYTKDNEEEVNIGFAFAGNYSIDIAIGKDNDPEDGSGDGSEVEQDYTYIALGWADDTYSATIAHMAGDESETDGVTDDDSDYDYTYIEFGAGGEVGGMDLAFTLGKVVDVNDGGEETDASDYYMVLDLSKSFSF